MPPVPPAPSRAVIVYVTSLPTVLGSDETTIEKLAATPATKKRGPFWVTVCTLPALSVVRDQVTYGSPRTQQGSVGIGRGHVRLEYCQLPNASVKEAGTQSGPPELAT